MSTYDGNDGVVKVGANTVAEVKSWAIEETMDTKEDTAMGDNEKTYKAGKTEWSGSLDCFWDKSDTNGQVAMTVGSSVSLSLYPAGEASGDLYYSGTALIKSVSPSGEHEGLVERSFSFQGSGALAQLTVI